VHRAWVPDAVVHLVRREQSRHGAGLVHDAVDLLEHALVVAGAAVDAPVPSLFVQTGDVADDSPTAVLVGPAARTGREDHRGNVEPLVGVGVQEVPDGAAVGVGL